MGLLWAEEIIKHPPTHVAVSPTESWKTKYYILRLLVLLYLAPDRRGLMFFSVPSVALVGDLSAKFWLQPDRYTGTAGSIRKELGDLLL